MVKDKKSYGVIVIRNNKQTKRSECILVQKKNTYEFTDILTLKFIKQIYPKHTADNCTESELKHANELLSVIYRISLYDDIDRLNSLYKCYKNEIITRLTLLIESWSVEEDEIFLTCDNFKKIWAHIWSSFNYYKHIKNKIENPAIYMAEESFVEKIKLKSEIEYTSCKKFYDTFRTDIVKIIYKKSNKINGLLWVIPSGRKCTNEPALTASLRELKEETNISINELHINVSKNKMLDCTIKHEDLTIEFEKSDYSKIKFKICDTVNKVDYIYILYIAFIKNDDYVPKLLKQNSDQMSELNDIKWFDEISLCDTETNRVNINTELREIIITLLKYNTKKFNMALRPSNEKININKHVNIKHDSIESVLLNYSTENTNDSFKNMAMAVIPPVSAIPPSSYYLPMNYYNKIIPGIGSVPFSSYVNFPNTFDTNPQNLGMQNFNTFNNSFKNIDIYSKPLDTIYSDLYQPIGFKENIANFSSTSLSNDNLSNDSLNSNSLSNNSLSSDIQQDTLDKFSKEKLEETKPIVIQCNCIELETFKSIEKFKLIKQKRKKVNKYYETNYDDQFDIFL